MNYSDWLKTAPAALTEDSLWKMEAYRLALFAAELAWHDVTKLMRDGRTLGLASQLYEASGSIGTNLSQATPAPAPRTGHGSTNTRLAPPAKAGLGITKDGPSLAKLWLSTACVS